MKKSSLTILLLLLLIIFSFYFFDKNSYRVISVSDDCELNIDFNHDRKIQENEFYQLKNINSFCSQEELEQNQKIIGNLSDDEKLYFKIISKKYYEKIFLNSVVHIKNNSVFVNFQNAEKLILNKGLALPKDLKNSENYKNLVLRNKNDAKNVNIVLLNTKSLKYHKTDCPKGLKSKNKIYLLTKDLPKKAKPCPFCHLQEIPKSQNNLFSPKSDYTKENTYNNIKIFSEHGGNLLPSSKCDNKLCLALKQEIESAKSTIDIAVYEFINQPELIKALQKASQRGVKIRAVTDDSNIKNNTQTFQNLKTITDKIYYDKLPEKDSSRLMHNKFLIIDKEKVWTGSANLSNTGLSGFNANNSVLINSKEAAKIYENEFENFVNGKFHSAKNSQKTHKILVENTPLEIYFSPQDNAISSQIIPEIKKAKKYIYIPIFIITHKTLAHELINAKNRGVEVKLIIDATSARNKYSQHSLLRQNKIAVKTENFAGKMHMKNIIIDDNIVFLGSMNLTKSGNVYNDENYIKITNSQIAKDMKKHFSEIWNTIPDKYLYKDPAPESFDSVGSCFDGVDNDYDEKIDREDTGCFTK